MDENENKKKTKCVSIPKLSRLVTMETIHTLGYMCSGSHIIDKFVKFPFLSTSIVQSDRVNSCETTIYVVLV